MKKAFLFLAAAGIFFAVTSDLEAQCRRGEIMTDAGCVKQHRKRPAPKPMDERQIAKQALHNVFAQEEKQYPALKAFLNDESKKPFQHALADLKAKRNGGELKGLQSWIQQGKDWYVRATGIADFLKPAELTADQEKQIAKQALHEVFAKEEQKYPALKEFLSDETKKPFQHALADLRAKRDGGGLEGVKSWIQKGKDWYLNATGIKDVMIEAPVIHAVTPEEGGVGSTLTITGDHLRDIKEAGFYWGTGPKGQQYTTAVTPKIISTKEIRIAVPKSDVNSGTIFVKNNAGTAYAKKSFKITAPPVISEIYPYEAMPGQTIHVIGSNFEKVQSVTVDGKPFPGKVNVAASSSIDITLSAGSPAGTITVTTASGSAKSPKPFTIKNIGPVVTGVGPGKVYPGDTVTIRGDKLQHPTEVKFSNTKGEILSSNTYEIKVKAPEAFGSHAISVRTLYGSADFGKQRVEIVAKPAPPPPPKKEESITKNALGNPEYCFGAVGKGCGGFGDLKDDETKGTRPGWLAAGCSEEKNGMRRCWVVPGSIKHDNCCVKYPSGKHCGGPGRNPFNKNEPDKDWFTGEVKPAGESNHDGHCENEWDDAFWDVKNGRGWEADFAAKQPGDLTPASSPGGRYHGGERAGTANLCAPDSYSISARHSVHFCCSGNVKKYWAVGVEDWYICEPRSGGRSVQKVAAKQEGTPTQLDMSKTPSKPGGVMRQPVLASLPKAAQRSAKEREIKPADMEFKGAVPPPANDADKAAEAKKRKAEEELAKKRAQEEKLDLKKKQEEELAKKKALEEELKRQREQEELARRQRMEEEQAPSHAGQYCDSDAPRYNQPGCIEPPEQEGPPPTQGQPCNPNVPRYQQPGCVE